MSNDSLKKQIKDEVQDDENLDTIIKIIMAKPNVENLIESQRKIEYEKKKKKREEME